MMLRALTWSFAILAAAALFRGAWNLAVVLADHASGGPSGTGIWIDLLLVALWSAGLLASFALMSRREWGRRLLQTAAAALAALTAGLLAADYLDTSAIGSRSAIEWTLSLMALLYFVAVTAYLGTTHVTRVTSPAEAKGNDLRAR